MIAPQPVQNPSRILSCPFDLAIEFCTGSTPANPPLRDGRAKRAQTTVSQQMGGGRLTAVPRKNYAPARCFRTSRRHDLVALASKPRSPPVSEFQTDPNGTGRSLVSVSHRVVLDGYTHAGRSSRTSQRPPQPNQSSPAGKRGSYGCATLSFWAH